MDPSWHQDGMQGIHSQDFSADQVWSWQCCEEANIDLQEQWCDAQWTEEKYQTRRKARKVTFADEVDLFCYCETCCAHAVIHQDSWHLCCRSLWHEHGQLTNFKQFQAVLNVYNQRGEVVDSSSTTTQQGIAQQSSAHCTNFPSRQETVKQSGGVLHGLRTTDDSAKAEFADTWFLDDERFPLCIKPRKLKLVKEFWTSDSFLQESCKTLVVGFG